MAGYNAFIRSHNSNASSTPNSLLPRTQTKVQDKMLVISCLRIELALTLASNKLSLCFVSNFIHKMG